MAAIKLGAYNVINSDDISSAQISEGSHTLVIQMKNGKEHWVRYGTTNDSVWEIYRKIEIMGILGELGVTKADLEQTNSSHIRVTFTYKGQTITYVTGGSPSDWRASIKMKCDLKRMMREIDTADPALTGLT